MASIATISVFVKFTIIYGTHRIYRPIFFGIMQTLYKMSK
jgi:hypothetical protein